MLCTFSVSITHCHPRWNKLIGHLAYFITLQQWRHRLTADEARVLDDLLLLLLLWPEVGEGVDDDTEDEVQDDDDDDEEEEHVVNDPGGEQPLLAGRGPQDVADAAAVPESLEI